MVDIQTVSIAVASASVTVAAIYYVWQIRHQGKLRQMDLVIRLASEFKNREFLEAQANIFETEFTDYDDFVKKYGKLYSSGKYPISFQLIANFFEQVGILYKNKLIEPVLIDQILAVSVTWEKLKRFVEYARVEYHDPRLWEWFEYLYNEMKKREQRK